MNQTNKVQNPETPINKTPEINDRDIINDLLATEKYMTASYNVVLNEASNEDLYQDLLQIFNETQNMQRRLYNLMFKNGWYSIEKAEPQKISQAAQQYSGYKNQFPVH